MYGYCTQCRHWRQLELTSKGKCCDRCRRIYRLEIRQSAGEKPKIRCVAKRENPKKRGISDRMTEVLNFLASHGPATTDEIQQALGKASETPSAVRSLLWRMQKSGKIISRKFAHKTNFSQCWGLPHQEEAIASKAEPLLENEKKILESLADGCWKSAEQIFNETAWEKSRSNFYSRLLKLKYIGLIRDKKKRHKTRLWALLRSTNTRKQET